MQVSGAGRGGGAKPAQSDRVTAEGSDDFTVGVRLKRDVLDQPHDQSRRYRAAAFLCPARGHRVGLKYGDEAD